MVYRGRVKDGVVVLEEGVRLAEGTEVEVGVPTPAPDESAEVPTLYERLKPIIGIAKGLPPDASKNLDHYLYGLPKR